jgi:hypothetical protein
MRFSLPTLLTQGSSLLKSAHSKGVAYVKNNPQTTVSGAMGLGAIYTGYKLHQVVKRDVVVPLKKIAVENKRSIWWILAIGIPTSLLLRLAALIFGIALVEPFALAAASIIILVFFYVYYVDHKAMKIALPVEQSVLTQVG